MTEFNSTLQRECRIAHGFQYAHISGFQFNPQGQPLDIIQLLPDGCHPRGSQRGFHKYKREMHNIIMMAKPQLAQLMFSEGRLRYR